MKFTFLGTSAGKPTRDRNVSAMAFSIENENGWTLFDCGEATQHQILRSELKSGGLRDIFITHLHGDHYYGLLGLIDSFKMENRKKPLALYVPKNLKYFLLNCMDTSFEKLGYELNVIEFKEHQIFKFEKYLIKVLPLVHSVESFAFLVQEHDKSDKIDEEKLKKDGLLPSKAYGDIKKGIDIAVNGKVYKAKEYLLKPIKGRRVIIAGDNSRPEILGEYLEDLDLLIHESTYTKEIYDNLPVKVLHTTAFEIGRVAQKYRVKNLIVTHISPRYNDKGIYPLKLIEDEVRLNYKGNFWIAEDFLAFCLKRSRDERVRRVVKCQ